MLQEGLVRSFSSDDGGDTKRQISSFSASPAFSLGLPRAISPTMPAERQHGHTVSVAEGG